MDWETLIKLFEKNRAYGDYVAECVYAHLAEHGDETPEDRQFMEDISRYLEGGSE